MQGAEEYGGGVYSAPPIPLDHSGLYGGSPSYGPSPPSAPSAPAFAQATPSYYQTSAPTHSNNPSNNPSVPTYDSHLNSSFSQQIPIPSYSNSYPHQNPPPPLADHSSSPSSYSSNLYPPHSYAPVVPSYPPVSSPYDRSFEALSSSTASADSTGPQQRSLYSRSGSGLAPQTSGGFDSGGYDSYGQGKIGYSSQGEHQGYGGAMYDQGAGYDKAEYGLSELGNYGHRDGADRSYDSGGFLDVYAYDGGGAEPYGARGTGSNSWGGTGSTGGYNSSSDTLGSKTKITRATPKADGDGDLGGVQKFRVKMLPESRSSDSVKDVVCQIGLDGVRMVDPTTSRTLRIYPLDTITKWEVKEPSVFTFWAKSAVDIDQRIIQLKSSSSTTTAILDTLTAACVQLCEMVGKDGPSEGSSSSGAAGAETSAIRRGSVLDWVAIRPRAPTLEEKQHWVPDEAVTKCTSCDSDFGPFLRRHHCRNCGDIFCDKCTRGRINLNTDDDSQAVRVCDRCLAEVTHRLENMTKASSKVSAPQRTHEDLAKKLQEELERTHISRKPVSTTSSSGSASSRQTSVLNCSKCGSISLVSGNSSRCSNCGADPGNARSITEKTTSTYSAAAGPRGPPHLWSSNASGPDGPGPQMREVACPTCTVHLQVQVPSFGTETIECGVCQHPFLVSA